MKKLIPLILGFCLLTAFTSCCETSEQDPLTANRWTKERAQEWFDQQPWIVGCNFIPSNAINQLEMWQEDTFSPELIEIGRAHV